MIGSLGGAARTRAKILAALPCLAIASLVACSTDGPSSDPSTPDGQELRDSTLYPGAYALPSEQVGLTPEQRSVVSDWEESVSRECMADKGVAMPVSAIPEDVTFTQPRPAYGVVDPEWAAQYGYLQEFDVLVPDAPTDDPNSQEQQTGVLVPTESQEFLDAWNGVEAEVEVADEAGRIVGRYRPDGCLYEPAIQLGAEDYYRESALREQVDQIASAVATEVQQSEEFRAAEEEWRSCMAESGYTVDGATEPGDRAALQLAEQTPESIAQAVADVGCKNSTGFLRIWSRLRAEVEWQEFQANPGLLEELAQFREAAYARVVGAS